MKARFQGMKKRKSSGRPMTRGSSGSMGTTDKIAAKYF